MPRTALGEAYDRFSDLGLAVADVLARGRPQPGPGRSRRHSPRSPPRTRRSSRRPGPARKSALFRDLLVRSDPITAKYLVKILSGELRIGLREGLVEAAIAKAFDRPLTDVKWAGMLTGDVGRAARRSPATTGSATAELALFQPLKFMLASPAEDANEILARLGPEVWVEDKYDGIRAQLHRQGDEVRLYSRDLHDITRPVPGGGRGGRRPAVGRHPRRRDPRLEGRRRAAVHRAPGAARAQVAVARRSAPRSR